MRSRAGVGLFARSSVEDGEPGACSGGSAERILANFQRRGR